ncbi:MAG: SIMPL domain-containing protein [Deltaproteobacteria bacterium]|nr:SIMPL domain-containing protein [Deltaproteobacteria bacterium]MBW1872630.1 SIMPL domain-containing protein [Deltaproteobacteria bacterium]
MRANSLKTILILLVLIGLPTLCLAEELATIEVSTTGVVYLEADIAFVDFMVKHTAQSPRAARDGNQKALTKFIKAMKKSRVRQSDILVKPVSLLVYKPQDLRYMDGLAPKLPQQHETAIRVVRIKVHKIKTPDMPKVWKLVDTAMAAGAEPVRDTRGYYSVTQNIPTFITLGIENQQSAVDNAIRDAFSRAKQQAEHSAAQAGLKVKGLHDAKLGLPSLQLVNRDSANSMIQRVDSDTAMLGKIKTSVTINATYQVSPR